MVKRIVGASKEQRAATLTDIETRLALYGLSRNINQIGELLEIVERFVEDGVNVNGSIPLETGQRIEYVLQNRPDPREPHKSFSSVIIKK